MRNWEENVRKVVPYVPGEQPKERNLIKLNTNENPYPPSPKVEQVLQEMNIDCMRLYPDPTAHLLVEAIADFYHLKEEQVFVGVGSDDVLAMVFMTFFNSTKPILFPDITYSFYDVWADMLRIPYERIPLKEDFTIEPEDYFRENGGIIFPNPNAPTGVELPLAQIEKIIQANPDVIVVVDEAYVDFGAESALPLIDKYDNLLVVQTFSKSRGMAGMRIGYAMGNPVLIKYLNDVKYSFNSYTMDQTTIALGKAAVEDKEYFEDTVNKVVETREWTKKELSRLGFVFGDSKTNFIFASHKECPARELFVALRKANIIVRYFDKPRIDNYLRITIGTQEEMETLVRFLENYLSKGV
ncbi:MAG: histidinol-phosphate transaminase [Oliverpabstia sp.]|nr:histidinol-phosphate transaminase [Oliverpabstia sp.]